MTTINSNFESNFNAIFFGGDGVERKGVPKENGKLKKFYTTSLDRHDKSNVFFQFLAKVLHVDSYNRENVLSNISLYMRTKSADLRIKITPENYEQFRTDLLAMSSALAKDPESNNDLIRITSIVDGLNPNRPTEFPSLSSGRSEPRNIPTGSPSHIGAHSALDLSADALRTSNSSLKSSKSDQTNTSPLSRPQLSESLQEKFKQAETSLSMKDMNFVDFILLNHCIVDIQREDSFGHSKEASQRLTSLLETYLNRKAPQNPNGTISEQIIALDAHIKEAKEIATMIVPYSPTSKQWTLKIQDLESQRQHLLESTQKAIDEAGEKFLPTLHRLFNEKLSTSDQTLLQMQNLHSDLGIESPMNSDISTAFASLTHETAEQLKLARESHRKIAAEATSSLLTEKHQLEAIEQLIAIPLDRTELYKSAAESHHGSGVVNVETFHALNLQICQKKEALETEKKAWFKDDQKIRELEFEILTLKQKCIIFDYKLLVQKFARESLPILKRIQEIAKTKYLGDGNLAQLKLEIAAYTQKCNELQKDLDIIKKGMSYNKSEISQFHATVLNQTGLPKGFLKKIENLKNTVEYDIRNFTSLEDRLKEEMDVSAVASHYERRIATSKRTMQLLQQKGDAEGELEQAENNQKAFTEIQKLIKWQADYTVRMTAMEVSPKGTTPYENFLRAFAIDARGRHIPEDRWADMIVKRLEKQFIIPEVHKPLLTDNINKALGQMGLIKVSLPVHRNSF